ncbi:MAG: helix-turn-helix transcriptional regulator [Actinobacteria bacterium]|nr:helix-turn-helix transcriptional regulator [Actinomycetota bacterium]MBI3686006.1 helix-turn-helix transcriptional regulator [Actinomycetota bacterium]
MNTIDNPADRPDPNLWADPEMRQAVTARDIGRVYRLLQRRGISQQRIGALVGQSQPEVSAIMRGRRVLAYDVLARISDGLGVPRELMGLAGRPGHEPVGDP